MTISSDLIGWQRTVSRLSSVLIGPYQPRIEIFEATSTATAGDGVTLPTLSPMPVISLRRTPFPAAGVVLPSR